jgi:uncharacterized membrane protein
MEVLVRRSLTRPALITAVLLAMTTGGALGADAAEPPVPGVATGCTWHVRQLAVPTGWAYPITIAAKGEDKFWVGYGTDGLGSMDGLLWQDGQVQRMPTPGPGTSRPYDVNRSGTVVATWLPTPDSGSESFPYLWRNGTITRLALPAGATSAGATAINDAGDVIGGATVNGALQGVRWSAASPNTPVLLGSAGNVNAYLNDISDRGAFVGRSQDGGYGRIRRAVGGTTSPARPLQDLPGLSTSAPSTAAATEGTWVVGTGRPAGSSEVQPVGLYVNATRSSTPQILAGGGTPASVNSAGLIVGNGSATIRSNATAWTTTRRWTLPHLFTATTATSHAQDVMEDGTVIGYGGQGADDTVPVAWNCS